MSGEEQEVDGFEGDPKQQREEMRDKAIEFAKLYEIFVDSPRGQELLEFWEKTVLNISTPVESSIQRYAADEGARNFIRNIQVQIKLARERF